MPSTQTFAFTAPPLALLAMEPLRAALDLCAARLGWLEPVEGDGHPVVVYPGLGAGPLTTAQLRNHLRSSHFDVHDWGLGVNTGPEGALHEWLEQLVERVRALRAQHGRKVSLVGWSLGGIYAREVAKAAPDSVRQVVTLATPFGSLGGGNHAGTIFRMMGGSTAQLTPELQAHLRQRPPVPTTSIYSRSDGVVCWRGCLEPAGPQVENVAVHASHLGMPSHPDVLRIVADRLALPEDGWRPYKRRASRVKPATAPSRSRPSPAR
jgi:triacylglycerol esterase/lipase EstA (alpha/beta hydrolase family)